MCTSKLTNHTEVIKRALISTEQYVPVNTGMYQYVIVCPCTYLYILVCTSMFGTYMYVPYIFCTEQYVPVHTSTYMYVLHFNRYSCQVELINAAIDKAKKGSYLHGLPHVADPSEEIQEVLIACVEWNMEISAKDIPEADLPPCSRKL